LAEGSRARAIYGAAQAEERYHCNFGLNPAYRAAFAGSGLAFSGVDTQGEIRVAELDGHPFFFATLFQPELQALEGRDHPLIRAYVQAAVRSAIGAEAATP
jgi:CTP synthase (UTP-ammonia lyase)